MSETYHTYLSRDGELDGVLVMVVIRSGTGQELGEQPRTPEAMRQSHAYFLPNHRIQ